MRPLYIFVDVDETLIRNYGTKRIPILSVIEHVKNLHAQGAILYCWSSGGADYARASAIEVKLEHCFEGFLPKPQVLIDDTKLANWRVLKEVHPNSCAGFSVEDYRKLLFGEV
jgi:Protein of unknown function (DUF705)